MLSKSQKHSIVLDFYIDRNITNFIVYTKSKMICLVVYSWEMVICEYCSSTTRKVMIAHFYDITPLSYMKFKAVHYMQWIALYFLYFPC